MASIAATGYVHRMIDNQMNFEQFVMNCSRAMDALAMMRDDPMDAEIPERFEPSDYYLQQEKEVRAKLAEIQGLSDQQLIERGRTAKEKALEYFKNASGADSKDIEACRTMLAQVEAWEPPTSDHQGLKEFMVQQLTSSIGGARVDMPSYWEERLEKEIAKSPKQYVTEEIAELHRTIARSVEEYAKEVERTESRNLWLKQLRESLATEVPV